ncbi:hypothetical protein CWI39_2551p0010 [Hamiltosporidium magnivora]|uniref:Macro domain-containing protein n=1 Tax=Hamiltosporidium magnivora TaxID=148818 RepID=A0A4Q9KUA5_9MICR|nr:hypothetical protein CWI39_2551p0010 [Hamiltosporidium magnivora]
MDNICLNKEKEFSNVEYNCNLCGKRKKSCNYKSNRINLPEKYCFIKYRRILYVIWIIWFIGISVLGYFIIKQKNRTDIKLDTDSNLISLYNNFIENISLYKYISITRIEIDRNTKLGNFKTKEFNEKSFCIVNESDVKFLKISRNGNKIDEFCNVNDGSNIHKWRNFYDPRDGADAQGNPGSIGVSIFKYGIICHVISPNIGDINQKNIIKNVFFEIYTKVYNLSKENNISTIIFPIFNTKTPNFHKLKYKNDKNSILFYKEMFNGIEKFISTLKKETPRVIFNV